MIKDLFNKLWKKSDNPYPISFGERLTRRIMLRMLIFMGVPMFILLIVGFVIFSTFANLIIVGLAKGQYEEVRRVTSEVMVASNNTAPFIEEDLDNPDKLYDIPVK